MTTRRGSVDFSFVCDDDVVVVVSKGAELVHSYNRWESRRSYVAKGRGQLVEGGWR